MQLMQSTKGKANFCNIFALKPSAAQNKHPNAAGFENQFFDQNHSVKLGHKAHNFNHQTPKFGCRIQQGTGIDRKEKKKNAAKFQQAMKLSATENESGFFSTKHQKLWIKAKTTTILQLKQSTNIERNNASS